MKPIYVPSFPSIEAAAFYAEKHQPLKRAMETLSVPGYEQYGARAEGATVACWYAAQKGDQKEMLKHMRALSWALPHSVFEYAGGRR